MTFRKVLISSSVHWSPFLVQVRPNGRSWDVTWPFIFDKCVSISVWPHYILSNKKIHPPQESVQTDYIFFPSRFAVSISNFKNKMSKFTSKLLDGIKAIVSSLQTKVDVAGPKIFIGIECCEHTVKSIMIQTMACMAAFLCTYIHI